MGRLFLWLPVLPIMLGSLAVSTCIFLPLTVLFLDSMLAVSGNAGVLSALYRFFLFLIYAAVLVSPVGTGVGAGILVHRRYV